MAAKRKVKTTRARVRPRKPATDRQKGFLGAIGKLATPGSQAPTAAAIGRELGITRKGARPQLDALREKGLVREVPIVIRGGWELTDAGRRALELADDAFADTERAEPERAD